MYKCILRVIFPSFRRASPQPGQRAFQPFDLAHGMLALPLNGLTDNEFLTEEVVKVVTFDRRASLMAAI